MKTGGSVGKYNTGGSILDSYKKSAKSKENLDPGMSPYKPSKRPGVEMPTDSGTKRLAPSIANALGVSKETERPEGLKRGGSARPGLYANIAAKRERIKRGSGEKMRKPGDPGAPTKDAFIQSAKTAKK